MSGYTVYEPEEIPVYINVEKNIEIEQYWLLHSNYQKKRHNKVMKQIHFIWYNIFSKINFIRNNRIDDENFTIIMNRIHNLFFIEYKSQIDYYNEEKLRLRKNNKYMQKKINKIKNNKPKI